ncbi:MAG: NBR1-Ig-like domain-containing protein, partial [Pyrinomonadaceae bacterium]
MGVPQEAARLGAQASRPRESKESILDDRFGASLEDLRNQIASLTEKFNLYRPDASWHGHPAHERLAPGKENASFYVHNKPTDFKLATTAQEQKQDSKQEPKQEQKKEDTKPTPTPTPSPSPTPPSSVQRLPIEIAPIEEPNPDQPCSDCGGGGGGGTPPPANRSPIGYLDGVGNGSVWGWTLDPDASAQPIHVHLYFDGPAGSGRSSTFDVGPANQSRPDVNQATGYPGDHGYSVSIPLQYRDGRSHSVYAYGIDTTGIGNVVLQSAPKFFTWFPPFNGAIYITQSVPTTMTTGQQYSVGVAMRNSGDKTWRSAESYFLGTQNPQDNFTGLIGRVSLPSDIAPGQNAEFDFTVTAPSTPGSYNFQWQMVQEAVEWFGDFTPNIVVNVVQPTGLISASPNPIPVCQATTGVTTINWTSANTSQVQVRINSPDGALVATIGAGSGSVRTSNWVTNGTVFYLQNTSDGRPLTSAHTLGTVTVGLESSGCTNDG